MISRLTRNMLGDSTAVPTLTLSCTDAFPYKAHCSVAATYQNHEEGAKAIVCTKREGNSLGGKRVTYSEVRRQLNISWISRRLSCVYRLASSLLHIATWHGCFHAGVQQRHRTSSSECVRPTYRKREVTFFSQ